MMTIFEGKVERMEQAQLHRLRQALRQASLPEFELDARGFPLPGPVIRYYRENMTYTDKGGNVKHWTQADLAQRLNLGERNIRLMETENKHLNSLERRWTLATLLKIPPALLGLASFEQLIDTLQAKPDAASLTQSTATNTHAVGEEEIRLYHDALPVLANGYDQENLKAATIEAWIGRITGNLDAIDKKHKQQVIGLLIRYHVLAGNLYSDYYMNWSKATSHFNTASQLTISVPNPDLKAFICYWIGEMYLNQRNLMLARDVFEKGLSIAKNTSPHLQGSLLAYTALARAMTVTDATDVLHVHRLLEQAEACVSPTSSSDLLTFDLPTSLGDRADTLITLKEYAEASDALEDASFYTGNNRHTETYLHILQAECYLKQKQPEYEEAVKLLSQVLDQSGHVQYYVNYVARLYKLLAASPSKNAPDVVDLGMTLREFKLKK